MFSRICCDTDLCQPARCCLSNLQSAGDSMLTQGYSCWQLASVSHTAVAGNFFSVSEEFQSRTRTDFVSGAKMCQVLSFSTLRNKCLQNRGVYFIKYCEKINEFLDEYGYYSLFFDTCLPYFTASHFTAVKIAYVEIPELFCTSCLKWMCLLFVAFVFGRVSVDWRKDKRQKYLPSWACTFNVCHTVLKKYKREKIIFF